MNLFLKIAALCVIGVVIWLAIDALELITLRLSEKLKKKVYTVKYSEEGVCRKALVAARSEISAISKFTKTHSASAVQTIWLGSIDWEERRRERRNKLTRALLRCDPIRDRDNVDEWVAGELEEIADCLIDQGVYIPGLWMPEESGVSRRVVKDSGTL